MYMTLQTLQGVISLSDPVESDSKIVNEDDSGDAILFENDDNWVTE